MMQLKSEQLVIVDSMSISLTGTGTPVGGGERPDNWDDDRWDINRWEDDGGRSPGRRTDCSHVSKSYGGLGRITTLKFD